MQDAAAIQSVLVIASRLSFLQLHAASLIAALCRKPQSATVKGSKANLYNLAALMSLIHCIQLDHGVNQ